MPINRAPFNALVDDDGSNTLGTPWNKAAIAGVILDPVDAAMPIVLAKQRAVTTLPTTENIGAAPVPAGSGVFDTIEVDCTFHTFPGLLQPLRLYYGTPDAGALEIARLDLLGAAGQITQTITRIRAHASGNEAVTALSWGANVNGGAPARQVLVTIPGPGTNNWTTAWTLYLQHPGIPAGDTLLWSWTVTRISRG